jgi:hypothetical protein
MCAECRRPGRSPRNPREPVREAALDPPNNSGQWRGAVRVIKCELCPTARFSGLGGRYISTIASRVRSTLPDSGPAAIISDVQTREFSTNKDKKYQLEEACLKTSKTRPGRRSRRLNGYSESRNSIISIPQTALQARLEHCLRNV